MKPEDRDLTVKALLSKSRYDFQDLLDIMAILRLPGGCMWDAEQTHKSIRDPMIEETYEVIEAIDNEDPVLLREELGDALFQIVFHARIEEEAERFEIGDVINDVSAKMIHRHPHVFGSVMVNSTENVLENWEKIKTEEKKRETLVSRLEAVPPQLPALMRASKIIKKTEFFFGEADREAALDAAQRSLDAIRGASEEEAQTLVGAFLYDAVALSRKLSVSAEEALTKTVNQKITLVGVAESLANGTPLEDLSREERDLLRKRLEQIDSEADLSKKE
jgi:tetrapyrrole methylase family protein/MazG family protein